MVKKGTLSPGTEHGSVVSSGRVTIRDVARHAGVSPTTVSFVVNGKTNASISAETRIRVMEAVERLGYRANPTAVSLRTARSNTIGLITEDIASGGFAGDTIAAAQSLAWASQKILLIVNTGRNPDIAQVAVTRLLGRQVEGVIIGAMWVRRVRVPAGLETMPTVMMNCMGDDPTVPAIIPDDRQGGRIAVAHLVAREHRRIGLIRGLPRVEAAWSRHRGYCDALKTADIPYDPSLVTDQPWTIGGGYDGTRALLALADPPTAIVCPNDLVAIGVYEAVKEAGLRIPDDVAVMGYDDLPLAAELRPALSSVALPHAAMGTRAMETLLKRIDGTAGLDSGILPVPATLVIRDST